MSQQTRIKPVLDVNEKPSLALWITLSLQHLFAMFGATVLVPILTGLPASTALTTSGIGTLTYLFITRGKIPAYLGSSFAFINFPLNAFCQEFTISSVISLYKVLL